MDLKKNENIEENKNKLEIFVDAQTFSKACYDAYKKECKNIRLPGFRVGKVPKKVLENMYGHDMFFESAIKTIYPVAVQQAIEESKLDVVDVEKFNIIKADEKQGLFFSIECILKPKVVLKNYKGLTVKEVVRNVTEKDVNDRLMVLKERCARITTLTEKRPAKTGDLVLIDFEGFVDGISIIGGKAKNYNLIFLSKPKLKFKKY